MRHFLQTLNETLENFTPSKEFRERKMAKHACFSTRIKNLLSKRNLIHKECLRTGEYESFRKFEELRHCVQNEVRLSKSEHFRRQFENCNGDSERTYRFLDLIGRVRKNFGEHRHS